MFEIVGNSVDEIFALGWNTIHRYGRTSDSRNGPVLSLPDLCVTKYTLPESRVLLLPERRHNPYFAMMETIWMLAGRNDLEFLLKYNKRMSEYSDDGRSLTGSAYGFFWRHGFGFDQLREAAKNLTTDPDTRRVVISHWNPFSDPIKMDSKDLPCNLQILFRVVDDHLNMTVYNRSNDFIYGQAGSNAVHFSMLLEYMSILTGYKVGTYNQVSNNLHLYLENPVYKRIFEKYGSRIPVIDPYDTFRLGITPMSEGMWQKRAEERFLEDIKMLTGNIMIGVEPNQVFNTTFFNKIIVPMQRSHSAHKKGESERALQELEAMPPRNDWKVACKMWLTKAERIGDVV